MKKSIFATIFAAGILFSGCSFDFFGLYPQSSPQKQSLISGSFKANIISYTRSGKTSYKYKFSEFGTNKTFVANSSRYYYNSGDVVNVKVQNGNIISMNLISRKSNPKPVQTTVKRRVDTSKKSTIKKNNSINVPTTESISF